MHTLKAPPPSSSPLPSLSEVRRATREKDKNYPFPPAFRPATNEKKKVDTIHVDSIEICALFNIFIPIFSITKQDKYIHFLFISFPSLSFLPKSPQPNTALGRKALQYRPRSCSLRKYFPSSLTFDSILGRSLAELM